ncbi:MAG: hypothetical protein HS122_14055 [Opitutaceae bacterium]|nr:hypothetical protein [Opitutaceae bacterium]
MTEKTGTPEEGTACADYGGATNRQFAYNGRGELTAGIRCLGANVTSQAGSLASHRQWEISLGSVSDC